MVRGREEKRREREELQSLLRNRVEVDKGHNVISSKYSKQLGEILQQQKLQGLSSGLIPFIQLGRTLAPLPADAA